MRPTPFHPETTTAAIALSARSHLRLAGAELVDRARDSAALARAREVVSENRSAARNPQLDPTDPRFLLAFRAAAELQGSALTPERRERLMRAARILGVRPFDASLIVAIAQDHARRGEPIERAGGILALLKRPQEPVGAGRTVRWTISLAALAAAALGASLLARWVSGA